MLMLTNEYYWFRSSDKLDKRLKRELIDTYVELRGIPCFLQKTWLKVTNSKKKYPVIITYAGETEEKDLTEINKAINSCGCKLSKQFNSLNLATATVNVNAIKKLIECGQILKICYDREVEALLDIATPTVKAERMWDQRFTGRGINVAVLDTGIHPHPDLINPTNRIISFVDLVNDKRNPYDDNGHGTHVAGCIAANGYQSKGKYRGPAFEARLMGVKVLNKTGGGSLSTVIEGVNWCINSKEKIHAMCLSLGATAELTSAEDPMCIAVRKAWEAGIVVCAAAGNDGPREKTVGSPGIEPSIITVGAMDDRGTLDRSDDVLAPFSSRGPTIDNQIKPDIVAPGTNIISLQSPNAYLNKMLLKNNATENGYTSMSGTSMATPIVVGLVAQLLEKYPQMTPDQVKRKLMDSAEDIGLSSWQQGAGYVQTST